MKLSRAQLERLKLYKYSGIDRSVLSRTILTPYWNQLIQLFPRTIAPNTITALGLLFVAINIITLLIFDPTYSGKPLPPMVYLSFALGLFAYQSMDAIDGKQARRTGMSGPLGEMFDHGCDAINTTLEVILCQAAFGIPRSWWCVASQAASLTNFYLSTWEEYHTGTLYLSPFSGPIEGILLICGIYLLTARFGQSIWHFKLVEFIPISIQFITDSVSQLSPKRAGTSFLQAEFVPWLIVQGTKSYGYLKRNEWTAGMTVVDGFMSFAAIALLFNIANAYWNVYDARKKDKKPVLTPLLGLLPFILNTGIMLAWLLAPNINIVGSSRMLLFLTYWGAGFAYQVGKLILAHVTKSEFPYWNWLWIWSTLGALDANTPLLFGREPLIQSSPERTTLFIALSVAVAVLNYIRFAKDVIWQITEFTGIACFTVRHKDKSGDWVDNEETVDEKKKQ